MAVATIRRSAGSPWNAGRRQLAMQIDGEIGSSSTGAVRFVEIQTSRSGASSKRPFSASIETSQTVMGETMQRPRKDAAARASGAQALIQTQACVSRTAAPILSRCRIPDFTRTGEVAQDPGRVGSSPEQGSARSACKGNHLGGGAAVPGNHHALLFVRDVFNNREALRFKLGHAQFHFF